MNRRIISTFSSHMSDYRLAFCSTGISFNQLRFRLKLNGSLYHQTKSRSVSGRHYHSGPVIDIPQTKCLTDFLFRNADNYSDKIALIDGASGESLRFDQLLEEIDNVTQNFLRLGIQRGDVVTIFGTNRMEFVHVLCACANLGVKVSLANAQLVVGELVTQMKLSRTKLLISTPDCAQVALKSCRLTNCMIPIVIGESNGCQRFDQLKEKPLTPVSYISEVMSSDIALLPFSSGTTGLPKGVQLTHFNLCAELLALSHPSYLPMTPGNDVSICALPMVHIAGLVIGTLNSLAQGATTVVLPRFTPETFLGAVQEFKGTFALIAPPVMTMLAKSPLALDYDISSLTTLYSGAACLEKSLTEAVAERLHLTCIRQGYGMTETSPATHTSPLEGWKFGSVGIPLPNTDSKIVDIDTGKELSCNEEGEIWVRGPQVMTGYHDNPTATENAFSADGWLKMGDIGYFDNDGHYYVVDRLKDIIKYKGYQVAPAYLESVLLSHPSVKDAAVIGVNSPEVGEVPAASVVLGGPCEEIELLRFVSERVAPYKRLRGGIKFVDNIPKSGSGKILRRLIRQEIQDQIS